MELNIRSAASDRSGAIDFVARPEQTCLRSALHYDAGAVVAQYSRFAAWIVVCATLHIDRIDGYGAHFDQEIQADRSGTVDLYVD